MPRVEDLIPPEKPPELPALDYRAMATVIPPLPIGEVGGMYISHRHENPTEYFGHSIDYPHVFDVLLEDITGQTEPTIWMSATPRSSATSSTCWTPCRRPDGSSCPASGWGWLSDWAATASGKPRWWSETPGWSTSSGSTSSAPGWELVVSDIEDYLVANADQNPERYDLVYLDTWDSGDFYHPGWATKLARLAQPTLVPDGRTVLWTYDHMVRDLRDMLTMVAVACQYGHMSYEADPGLHEFSKDRLPLAPFARWCLGKPRTPREVAQEIEAETVRWCAGDREGLTKRT